MNKAIGQATRVMAICIAVVALASPLLAQKPKTTTERIANRTKLSARPLTLQRVKVDPMRLTAMFS